MQLAQLTLWQLRTRTRETATTSTLGKRAGEGLLRKREVCVGRRPLG